jgi:hypothetical protein
MLARSSGMAWHGAEIPPIPCNIRSDSATTPTLLWSPLNTTLSYLSEMLDVTLVTAGAIGIRGFASPCRTARSYSSVAFLLFATGSSRVLPPHEIVLHAVLPHARQL